MAVFGTLAKSLAPQSKEEHLVRSILFRNRAERWPRLVATLASTMVIVLGACTTTPAATSPATAGPTGTPAAEASSSVAVPSGPVTLPAPEVTSLKLGSSGVNALQMSAIAVHANLFKKYGLDVELIQLEGAGRVVQAMQAGQIDVGDLSAGPVIASTASDRPLMMVMNNKSTITMVLASQSRIKTADDLRGQSIAISTFGALTHSAILIALKELGLTPEDVVITQVGDVSARRAALVAGSVGAGLFDAGEAPDLKRKGYNILADLSKSPIGIPGSGIVVTPAFAEQNPNTTLALVAASLEALQLAFDDRNVGIETYAEVGGVSMEKATEVVNIQLDGPWRPRDGALEEADFQAAKESLVTVDPALADLDVTAAYSTRFLDQLRDLGFQASIGIPGY